MSKLKNAEKKVLVIDDEADLRDMMRTRLEGAGYQVATACDGREGLEKVDQEKPDLILLDILMPDIDGFEFFKIIRKHPKNRYIPIIVLSARGSMRTTFEALKAEIFVEKPFDAKELMKKIDYMLSPKALLLSDDHYVTDKVENAFKKLNYYADTARSEPEFLDRVTTIAYDAAVVHLSNLEKDPANFMSLTSGFRNPETNIIVYCDVSVSDTDDDTVALERVIKSWKDQGIYNFYDARILGKDFAKVVDKWLES